MKQQSLGAGVRLLPSLALNKQVFDREYLLSLKDENLLFSFYTEAGLSGCMWINRYTSIGDGTGRFPTFAAPLPATGSVPAPGCMTKPAMRN